MASFRSGRNKRYNRNRKASLTLYLAQAKYEFNLNFVENNRNVILCDARMRPFLSVNGTVVYRKCVKYDASIMIINMILIIKDVLKKNCFILNDCV